MPRQYTVKPETLQPLSVRMEDLSPVSSMPTVDDQMGLTWDDAVETLPAAMGGALSIAGGGKSSPVGMLLAGIGGAGGEGWRQTINALQGDWDQVPEDLRGQAQAIVEQFAAQSGTEGVGRAIGPLLKFFGRAVYRTALKPGKAIRQEYPTVVRDAVEAGIPITRSQAGTAKAGKALDVAGDKVSAALTEAEARGAQPVARDAVLQATNRTSRGAQEGLTREGKMQQIREYRAQVRRENPPDIPLGRAQTMKRAEQKEAIQAYRKRARGEPINDIDLSLREDTARGLKEGIEQSAAGVGVTDVAARNQDVQKLIGVSRAVQAAEDRIANNNLFGMGDFLNLGGAFGVGSAVDPATGGAAFLLSEALTRPEVASRAGIALDRAGQPSVTPNVLRAIQILSGLISPND